MNVNENKAENKRDRNRVRKTSNTAHTFLSCRWPVAHVPWPADITKYKEKP